MLILESQPSVAPPCHPCVPAPSTELAYNAPVLLTPLPYRITGTVKSSAAACCSVAPLLTTVGDPLFRPRAKGASNGNYSLSNRVGPAVGTIAAQSQFARARLFEAGRGKAAS